MQVYIMTLNEVGSRAMMKAGGARDPCKGKEIVIQLKTETPP